MMNLGCHARRDGSFSFFNNIINQIQMAKIVNRLLFLVAALTCSAQLTYAASEFRAYTSSTANANCAYSTDGEAIVTIDGGERFLSGDWFTVKLLRNNVEYIAVKEFSSTTAGVTNLKLTELGTGYYFITLTDKNDETATAAFTIESPSAVVVTVASTTDINCSGDETGTATLVVTGGKEPYSVVCTDASTGTAAGEISVINNNVRITKLYKGEFSIAVTDFNGCTSETAKSIEIKSPFSPIEYTPSSNNVTCFGGNTGKIFGEAKGGKLPFMYTITNNTQPYTAGNSTGTFEGLPVGLYTATATDAFGCKVTVEDLIIGTPEEITVQDIATKPAATVVCAEHKTASIKFTVKGRIEVVAPSDTAIYYSAKLFNITEQQPVAVTDFKQSNKFHPVFTQPVYCDSVRYVIDPVTGDTVEIIPVHYVCGKDTLFDKGCHEPTKDRGSYEYPEEQKGYDCDDYITISGLGKGAYRIEFYRGNCQMGSYKEFTVEQTGDVPEKVYINELNNVCDESEITITPAITANPGITAYKWTLGGIVVGTSKELTHTFPIAEDKRILQLEATNACGTTASNTVPVTVIPRPAATVKAADKFLCAGNKTQITLEFKGTAPFYYTLTGEEEASTFEAVATTDVIPDQSATYTLTSLYDANCTAIIEKDVTPAYITIYPKQTVELQVSVPEPMVSGRYVTVTATPGFVSYKLEMGDTEIKPSEKSNIFKIRNFPYGESSSEFHLTATDGNGCNWTADASAAVKIETFPNIFTPNEDGVNDVFLEGWDIEVFDRWGTVMYSGTSGWNGKHNDVYVNPGVYLYVVKLTDQAGEPVIVKKTVTVER